MLKINITQLMTSIQDAPTFIAPEMDSGTSYLFNSIYKRISCGEDVHLSDLDFDAFDLEDIGSLEELFRGVFEDYNFKACGIVDTIRKIAPICKEPFYV